MDCCVFTDENVIIETKIVKFTVFTYVRMYIHVYTHAYCTCIFY